MEKEFNYLYEEARYFRSMGRVDDHCIGASCENCIFGSHKNNRNMSCGKFKSEYPFEATELIRKWAEEHPEPKKKTRADLFFEQYPNARRNNVGLPGIRPCYMDRIANAEHCRKTCCSDCYENYWNEPVEEKK